MSSFQSNPILSQIPLVVTPGSFQKPKPVTLPYDFQRLPHNINEFKDQSIPKTIENLKNLALQETQLIEKLQKNKNEKTETKNKNEDVVKFENWERQIRLMAPGYFGKDGSVGVVMTPTKHLRSDSQSAAIADSDKDDGESTKHGEEAKANGGTTDSTGSGSVAQDLAGLKI
ncbi:unnamed protein product [Ambrosiozyma monospora]|uniref:Unnamed protein product n=1 Tax=Ambrosiozyma monospora TaxID=43982 RepID=A0ACB5T9B6_AMBMO|nr:unnamed protein product [Ambrosiozyma monospora]